MKIKDNFFVYLIILVVTGFAFWPCLSADLLNWDDLAHVGMQPFVPFNNWRDIVDLFSSPNTVNRTYIPLTVLSFAVERHFWGFSPFVFHLNNILLHAFTAIMVCVLARRMGIPLKAACVAALIFALHPMRVESVAWVTERKDVLFGAFYVSALVFYWDYLKTARGRYYIGALVCAALSILAKPMALSLPLILFLMDWMAKRPRSAAMFWDKLPFMLALWPVALMTVGMNFRPLMAGPAQQFLIAVHAFMFYIIKFFIPSGSAAIYPVPLPVGWGQLAYGGSVVLLVGMSAGMWFLRKDRWLIFALVFYALSIFFVCPTDLFLGDRGLVSDRFSYVPTIGLALWAGVVWDRFAKPGWLIACVVCALLAGMTFNRCFVWRDSVTYWNDVLRVDPDNVYAFSNRAAALVNDPGIRARYGLSRADAYRMAQADLEAAVRWAPKDIESRRNLAVVREKLRTMWDGQ